MIVHCCNYMCYRTIDISTVFICLIKILHKLKHRKLAEMLLINAKSIILCKSGYIYRVSQKKVGSQKIIVFHELLSLGCINFENLCAHHQEEVLRFPKHPQLVKFG